ncbi:MAG: class I SAM-dependent methyltransferase, partial [Alphaproteobacteria bacterium]
MNQPSSPDPATIRAEQGDSWDRVAAAWARWWPVFEAAAQPVSDTLVARARLTPGQQVLDVATGIGEPAITAARRVLPGGHIAAADIAPAMLTQAQARAARLGIDNITFHRLDPAHPTPPEGPFDAVVCRWGLMFEPDVPATLKAWRARLRPGGRVAVAV